MSVLTQLLTVLLTVVAVAGLAGVAAAPAGASGGAWAPVHPGDFPDPSILHWNGVYYGFATQSFAAPGQGINIQEATSSNGVDWNPLSSDALPRGHLGSWAELGDTWAPSVAYDSTTDDFVMYYAATEASTGDQCIGIATAPVTSPLGPYTDPSPTPDDLPERHRRRRHHRQRELRREHRPRHLHRPVVGELVAHLEERRQQRRTGADLDLVRAAHGRPDAPDRNDSDRAPLVRPAVAKRHHRGARHVLPAGPRSARGTYYLFYSGSDEGASTYAIGWATCSGPSGPCADATNSNPLLTTSAGMSGPGGPDVYTLPSGQVVMALAAWQGKTIGYISCGIRPMYLADLSFSAPGGVPSLSPDPAGGTTPAASPTCQDPPRPAPGYWQVAADGGVFTFGGAGFYGSTGSIRLNKPVVGLAPTPDGGGYWLVASDGGVFAYGDAGFYGSTGAIVLNKPIIGMIPTITGHGYWLVASDGGVFAFGDAPFLGSAGGDNLAYPITAAAPSYLGGGYWLVDANGQVFSYGNATFRGQPAFAPGGYAITGMAPTHSSHGYWMASANGNVADFGDAAPYGSMYGRPLNWPIVGMAATSDGAGYWLQGADGGIFTFGDAPFLGSMGGQRLNAPMVGIAAT